MENEHAKYISQTEGKFRLRIINFQNVKKFLLETFSDDKIKYFFKLFPYTLETEITDDDIFVAIKLAVEFYEDLHLIELNGKEFILFDESSEFFEDCDIRLKSNLNRSHWRILFQLHMRIS